MGLVAVETLARAVIAERGVSASEADDALANLRQSADYILACRQKVYGASDRVILGLLIRAANNLGIGEQHDGRTTETLDCQGRKPV